MAQKRSSNAAKSKKSNNAGKGGRAQGANKAPLRASRPAEAAAPAAPLLDDTAPRDITGIVLAVFGVASLIAVAAPTTAPVTSALASLLHLGFGLGGYLIPLAILAFAALLFVRSGFPVHGRSVAGGSLIFVSVLALLALHVGVGLGSAPTQAEFFSPAHLSASGGVIGAAVAWILRSALGTAIATVVLLGLVFAGMVVLGLSISEVIQKARTLGEDLVAKRKLPFNKTPWGDAYAAAPYDNGRQPVSAAAYGNYAPDQLPLDDAGVDYGEDPFVDVSDQLAAEEAETTLLQPQAQQGSAPAEAPTVLNNAARAALDAQGGAKTTVLPHHDGLIAKLAHKRAQLEERKAADQVKHSASPHAAGSTPAAETREREKGSRVVGGAAAEAAGGAASGAVPEFLKAAAATAAPAVAAGVAVAAHPSRSAAPKAASAAATQKPNAASADLPWTEPDNAANAPAPAQPAQKRVEQPAKPVVPAGTGDSVLPPVSILRHNPQSASAAASERELEQTAQNLQDTLQEFGLHARVVGFIAGPTVTTFKVQPGDGERVNRIMNLEDDIALSLATDAVRIFAPIPGTSLVGIEIPNRTRQNVTLGDVLPYAKGGPLELAVGRDAEGVPVVADLAKMPHLLVAGTTGSGKSVMINTITMSMLMRATPEEVRLIMVDPKRVELSGYNGLPHLYVPVVTEPKQAASALQWGVAEMERRLKVFERLNVRNIGTFNKKQAAGDYESYDNPPNKMPCLVIIIDELSDLMMVAGKDVEASIVRIAQLGRAAGIHLIVATQRPSSDVVTGLIKANITNRIAFNVATGIDSRVIIDQVGAEKLIGMGDMLFSKVDWGKPKRIQGCYVSDEEIAQAVDFWKEQGAPEYHEEILSAVAPASGAGGSHEASDDDPLLWEAAQIVVETGLGSTSGLQRRLKVGYARAGRIMDMLAEHGVVGPPDGSKPREVLLDQEGLDALREAEQQMDAMME